MLLTCYDLGRVTSLSVFISVLYERPLFFALLGSAEVLLERDATKPPLRNAA